MQQIFTPEGAQHFIDRIEALQPDTQGLWVKMTVDQMLAHCNVAYEMIYDNKHPKPGGLKAVLLRLFLKPILVSEKPYKPNSPTAPAFKVVDAKNFEAEKQRLVAYINKTQELGASHFDGKASHSVGNLSAQEWNNMLAKHLDHHLKQFGV